MRRSSLELAQAAEDRAKKLRAEADRRRSVASDPLCSLLWEAEKAVRAVEAYMRPSPDRQPYIDIADGLGSDRAERWEDLKKRGLA